MGLASSTPANNKPASVLPIAGNGEYEHIGCADLMIGAENEDDTGLFARIFYPASHRPDAVSHFFMNSNFCVVFRKMTLLCILFGNQGKNI